MAIRDIIRDIGRALGIGRGNASGAGGRTRSIGGDVRRSMMSPGERQLAAMQERRNNREDREDRRKAAEKPETKPETKPVAPPVATTPVPPAAPAPVDLAAPTTSEVEAAAVESTQGGRASTILTSAQGLLAEEEPTGQLRRRRSLMGGGLIQ